MNFHSNFLTVICCELTALSHRETNAFDCSFLIFPLVEAIGANLHASRTDLFGQQYKLLGQIDVLLNHTVILVVVLAGRTETNTSYLGISESLPNFCPLIFAKRGFNAMFMGAS